MSDTGEVKLNKEIGQSGTEIHQGIITDEEYNQQLIGKKGLKKFDEMRRNDGSVRAALQAIILPLVGAERTVVKGKERHRQFIEDQLLHNQGIDFDDFLRQALTMLPFGHSLFEKVLTVVDYNGKKYIGIEKLGSRKQLTILAWELLDGRPGIQQANGAGKPAQIPWANLLVFTNEREGDNYEGISIIRSAFKHWYMKDKIYLIDAMSFERQGLGIISYTKPEDANPEDLKRARATARNIRANEEAYVEKPAGWDFGFMDMQAKTTRDPEKSVNHHDRQITKSVLAQFLEIGAQGSSGSYSAGSSQQRMFERSLEAIAKNIVSVINRDLIRPLCDMNFTDCKEYPEIQFAKIADDDIKAMAETLNTLVGANAITVTEDVEAMARDMLHLPEMPKEVQESYKRKLEDLKNGIIPGQAAIDPATGLPVQPEIDPKTGKPVDPAAEPEDKDKAKDPKKASDMLELIYANRDLLYSDVPVG